MNTKKLFMLLAALLLGSVSAFAQSGNNEPLKGDVNEDGVVDVADITAIIAIIKNNAAPQTTYYWYVGRQDTNGGSNAIGTADWETTNYDVFINSNDKQSATSLNDIKTALTGSVNVGAKSTGKEDVVIIAPTSVINQITSIKNASDAFNVGWDKMNPSNGYTTVYIENYGSTTLNIHF